MECDEQQVDPQSVTEPEMETNDVDDSHIEDNDETYIQSVNNETNAENDDEENKEESETRDGDDDDEAKMEEDSEAKGEGESETKIETNTEDVAETNENENESDGDSEEETDEAAEQRKLKKQLKYLQRQMKPRPRVNPDDKRVDLFQLHKDPFLSFQMQVEEHAETYKNLQERCRNQARFHYYYKVENFSFARKHAEKKPVEHRRGRKFSCFPCDTFFKTQADYDKHMASNQHSEIGILFSAMEDVAAEVFLSRNVEGHVIDSSILKYFDDGLQVDTCAAKYMQVMNPDFDLEIDESTFKDIECKDKSLKEFLEGVYDKILKPLWPENNDTTCVICEYTKFDDEDALLEHNKTEEHLEKEKTLEESWCHFCRVHTGSKENLIQHRTTQEHFDFKALVSKVHKKTCAYWSFKNVPEDEDDKKGTSDSRIALLAKFGLTDQQPPLPQKNKTIKPKKTKRGNPQQDSYSGYAKRFRNQQGPYQDSGYYPGYHEAHMDYQGPPGRYGPPPRDQYGGPPPRGNYGGPPQRDQYGGPPPRDNYGGPPPRDNYGGPPGRDSYGGPPQRDQYGGPPNRDNYGGPPPRDNYGGPPRRENYGGPPPRDGYGGPPPRDQYGGPPPRDQYGPPPRNQYEGPPHSGQFDGPPHSERFGGRPPPDNFNGPPHQFDGSRQGPPRGPPGMPPHMRHQHDRNEGWGQQNWDQGGWDREGWGERGWEQGWKDDEWEDDDDWKQGGRQEDKRYWSKEKKRENRYLPNGKRKMPAWRAERNRQRLVKYMEAKNEKAKQEEAKKLAEENRKLLEENERLMAQNRKLTEENKS